MNLDETVFEDDVKIPPIIPCMPLPQRKQILEKSKFKRLQTQTDGWGTSPEMETYQTVVLNYHFPMSRSDPAHPKSNTTKRTTWGQVLATMNGEKPLNSNDAASTSKTLSRVDEIDDERHLGEKQPKDATKRKETEIHNVPQKNKTDTQNLGGIIYKETSYKVPVHHEESAKQILEDKIYKIHQHEESVKQNSREKVYKVPKKEDSMKHNSEDQTHKVPLKEDSVKQNSEEEIQEVPQKEDSVEQVSKKAKICNMARECESTTHNKPHNKPVVAAKPKKVNMSAKTELITFNNEENSDFDFDTTTMQSTNFSSVNSLEPEPEPELSINLESRANRKVKQDNNIIIPKQKPSKPWTKTKYPMEGRSSTSSACYEGRHVRTLKTPITAAKKRQTELHNHRLAVEKKRLQLLEIKLARERDEMMHEQILFLKEMELKSLQLSKLIDLKQTN